MDMDPWCVRPHVHGPWCVRRVLGVVLCRAYVQDVDRLIPAWIRSTGVSYVQDVDRLIPAWIRLSGVTYTWHPQTPKLISSYPVRAWVRGVRKSSFPCRFSNLPALQAALGSDAGSEILVSFLLFCGL